MKKKDFSERLAEALSIREMTAAQLSRKTGIPEGTISCYKKGLYEAKQNRLWQIACALDVNPAWLMGYDVPMQQEDASQMFSFPYEGIFDDTETQTLPHVLVHGTTIFFEDIFLTESQIQEVRQFAAFVYQRDLPKDSNKKE